MAVIMSTDAPGAGAFFMDGMRAAGVVDEISNAPGFVRPISGALGGGYHVIELWEPRQAHQAWYDDHTAPNLPPDIERPAWEYLDLVIAVPE